MAISMQLFFLSVNSTPTKSDLEIDKENTQKEKDEQNIYFFERKTPKCIFFDLQRLWKIKYHLSIWDDIHKCVLNSLRDSMWHFTFYLFNFLAFAAYYKISMTLKLKDEKRLKA